MSLGTVLSIGEAAETFAKLGVELRRISEGHYKGADPETGQLLDLFGPPRSAVSPVPRTEYGLALIVEGVLDEQAVLDDRKQAQLVVSCIRDGRFPAGVVDDLDSKVFCYWDADGIVINSSIAEQSPGADLVEALMREMDSHGLRYAEIALPKY